MLFSFSASGSVSESADLLDKMTEADDKSPELFHIIGLMRAWDGNEAAAAEALAPAGIFSASLASK